ncbi:hypothetical protein AMAG_10685 [Allomyces macrogynus ATCC 38327]|uniref:HTH La-type RNA-binding domain-containing protein n=1 Tax=Allomyces macrogynus (strain ATCC 38327) TaxID=578462 RepID=A0A0L0SRP5_ALLM3|nr:hypothetical protein AMAG_10685 [Allomyces macrogynus ATCC 38327]|eukprot:KNE65019.1 hypothetical protein AMAG_10685 [Allomyces macrogynus ATCC 38327]
MTAVTSPNSITASLSPLQLAAQWPAPPSSNAPPTMTPGTATSDMTASAEAARMNLTKLKRLLEFYFSADEIRSLYARVADTMPTARALRDLMDSGWIPLEFLARYKRIKKMIQADNVEAVVIAAARASDQLRVREDGRAVRPVSLIRVPNLSAFFRLNELVVSALPPNVEPSEIAAYFSKYGHVQSVTATTLDGTAPAAEGPDPWLGQFLILFESVTGATLAASQAHVYQGHPLTLSYPRRFHRERQRAKLAAPAADLPSAAASSSTAPATNDAPVRRRKRRATEPADMAPPAAKRAARAATPPASKQDRRDALELMHLGATAPTSAALQAELTPYFGPILRLDTGATMAMVIFQDRVTPEVLAGLGLARNGPVVRMQIGGTDVTVRHVVVSKRRKLTKRQGRALRAVERAVEGVAAMDVDENVKEEGGDVEEGGLAAALERVHVEE